MRIGLSYTLWIGKTNAGQQLVDARLAVAVVVVELKDLTQLPFDAQQRIHRRRGLLKDHRDSRTAQLAQPSGIKGQNVFALETNCAVQDPAAGIGQQPEDRQSADRFAATGFANQPEDLSALQLQIDAVGDRNGAADRIEADRQIAQFQQSFIAHRTTPPSGGPVGRALRVRLRR